ncbi:MAG: 50S ribosomal protein L30 [Candidatus Neomarinimicrobiota bacterium]|nr:50S ribosomal protein L30 [Candidatus Neomarinimicrobiota bacterium]RKY54547.1 MAG: 50S ribosomal protein L30 [Candidatus Neomarinimicrobiota bacterium]
MNAKKKEKLLKITQIKSAIGYRKKAKLTLEALGLRRMHQTVIRPDNPAIRGMIRAVSHLVKVEEVES